MRRPALTLVLLLALGLAGCGDDTPDPPPPAVKLDLLSPADAATVDAEQVEVRGRVVPAAAEVRVMGRPAEVTGGTFAATVELEEGANLVDVTASAGRRRPASTALRVVREVPIEIPDLQGEDARSAIADLEALGLEVERTEGGGLLDDLLPGDEGVCAVDPEAGTEVRRGSTVTVETAKAC